MLPEHLSNSPLWVIISDKKARVVPIFRAEGTENGLRDFRASGRPVRRGGLGRWCLGNAKKKGISFVVSIVFIIFAV